MSPEPPGTSIVLPTYNREHELGKAVRSVLAQTHGDFELLIVDDGSTDRTDERVRSFDDPRVHYVKLDHNVGASAARNAGLREARGRWIGFQDSDDEWRPDKLERQVAALATAPAEVGFVYTAYERLLADGTRRRIPERGAAPPPAQLHRALLRRSLIGTPTLLMRRECLDRAGGFDERLRRFQDWELMIRVSRKFAGLFIDEPLVLAHTAPGGISAGHDDALVDAERRILEKHRAAIAAAGPDVLAHRTWHLGHVLLMRGRTSEGRALVRRAAEIAPRPLYRVAAALALSGAGYRLAYRARSAVLGRRASAVR